MKFHRRHEHTSIALDCSNSHFQNEIDSQGLEIVGIMRLSEKALYFQKKPMKRCHHSERSQRDALWDQLCLCGPISKLKIALNCGKATGSALTVYRIPNWPQLSSQECVYTSRNTAFETVCVQVGRDTLKAYEFVGGGCSHCGK